MDYRYYDDDHDDVRGALFFSALNSQLTMCKIQLHTGNVCRIFVIILLLAKISACKQECTRISQVLDNSKTLLAARPKCLVILPLVSMA